MASNQPSEQELDRPRGIARPDAAPTVRQVYALASALCGRLGEDFPATRLAASEAIERLRIENGHPAPRLADAPPRRRRRRKRPYPWWQHVRPRPDVEASGA
jgi:hypothetical protein